MESLAIQLGTAGSSAPKHPFIISGSQPLRLILCLKHLNHFNVRAIYYSLKSVQDSLSVDSLLCLPYLMLPLCFFDSFSRDADL